MVFSIEIAPSHTHFAESLIISPIQLLPCFMTRPICYFAKVVFKPLLKPKQYINKRRASTSTTGHIKKYFWTYGKIISARLASNSTSCDIKKVLYLFECLNIQKSNFNSHLHWLVSLSSYKLHFKTLHHCIVHNHYLQNGICGYLHEITSCKATYK